MSSTSSIPSVRRLTSMLEVVRRSFRSEILHNATWMLSGQGLQLIGRMGYFLIVAHVLGPSGYGSFVACTALVAAMAPFASLGTGHVMIKYVANDRNTLPMFLGNALLVTLAGGSILTVLALFLRPTVLPQSVSAAMLTAVALADLIGMEMNGIFLQVFLALQEGRRYSQLTALSTSARVLAALILLLTRSTPRCWAYLYAASAAIAAVIGLLVVARRCAVPRFHLKLFGPSVREGIHFATALSSQSIYNDIDKTMLARMSSVESAAIYAVAYRFIEPAIVPIRSVASASYPEFFRQGRNGVTAGFRFARRILARAALYGVTIGAVLFFAAGFIPAVLGHAYEESTTALRWLCVLPIFKCVHIFLSDTLTGANYQWQTSSAQMCVSVFNILVNLWIIRAFAWRGAAWSSLLTDAFLMALLYMIIRWHLRRERLSSNAKIGQPAFAAGGS